MTVYDNPRMARAYAFCRPPVHPQIVGAIAGDLPSPADGGRALDVGCGAGRSTAALAAVAAHRVGLEPARAMLAHCREVDAAARFAVGRAERLPFAPGRFDIVAAAGSLNYVDLGRFLPEAARVLRPDGVLLVYDFSAARRVRGDTRLDEWFARFERRYPFPGGAEMDIRRADLRSAGLRLGAYRRLEPTVPMTLEVYLDYVMSETNVEMAIEAGAGESEIRAWCLSGLTGIFEDGSREIVFDAYAAIIVRV